MQVKPLRKYCAPALPLAMEDVAPQTESRCRQLLQKLAAMGLLSVTCWTTLKAGEPASAAIHGANPEDKSAARTDATTALQLTREQQGMFRIAPLILDALAREGSGRGAFGCVAISAPTFLSEEDGVAIIRAELEKVGMKMGAAPAPVQGVRLPHTNSQEFLERDNKSKPEAFQKNTGTLQFDGASEDGKVVFEYVSEKDFKEWEDTGGEMSTVSDYDMVKPATNLAASLAKTPDAQGRIVLVVCDPMVQQRGEAEGWPKWPAYDEPYPDRTKYPEGEAGDKQHREDYYKYLQAMQKDPAYQKKKAEYREALNKKVREAASSQIQRQLEPQLEYLRKQGLLIK